MTDPDGADAPFDGYDDLNVTQVAERLQGLDAEGVAAVKAYEAANQNRKTIADWEPVDAGHEVARQAPAVDDPARPTYDPEAEEYTAKGWASAPGRPPLGELAKKAGAVFANVNQEA